MSHGINEPQEKGGEKTVKLWKLCVALHTYYQHIITFQGCCIALRNRAKEKLSSSRVGLD